jgi:hypothetical protein
MWRQTTMLWIFVAIAVVGSLTIKYIASRQVGRALGTTALHESVLGWRKAEFLGLPAPYLFYAWFWTFGGIGMLLTLGK